MKPFFAPFGRSICAILFFWIPFQVSGQNIGSGENANGIYPINIDSLNGLVEAASSPSEKVKILNQFSFFYRDHSHRLGMTFARQALAIAEQRGTVGDKVAARLSVAEIYINYIQDYENGLSHLTEARELNQATTDMRTEVVILRLMGFVHGRMDDLETSRKCYEEAISIAEEHQLDEYISILTYMADMLVSTGQKEEGMKYYEKVIELDLKEKDKVKKPEVNVSLASYYLLQNKPEMAELEYRRAVGEFEAAENWRWASYVWSEIAMVNLTLGRDEEALASGLKGLEIAEKYSLSKELGDNHATMTIVYDSLGNYQQALYHFRQWAEISDEMISVQKAREIASIQKAHEFALQEQDLLLVKQEKELELNRSRIISAGTGMGILLVGLVSLFLFRGYRQKQRVNSELEDRVELKDMALTDVIKKLKQEVEQHQQTQDQLASSYGEFNHFVHQTSHDLRGPLSSVLGLVSIAEQDIAPAERLKYLGLIGTSTHRLRKKLDSLIQVVHLTDTEVQLKKIELCPFVNEVIAQAEARN